jgi:amidase
MTGNLPHDELTAAGAGRIAALVAAGEVSRREVALAYLERIDEAEPAIGAFSVRRDPERVLAEAEEADARPVAARPLPLDGVPMIVKEGFDVAGLPSTEGVRARADVLPEGDSLPVARLRAAGALILGKGKQPDFKSRWNTISDLHGSTRNPHDPSRSAGGSSGGDAAAVAAGFAAAGLGSDFGGSIRVPASFCRVAGIRTSPGLIPDVDAAGLYAAPPTVAAMSSLGPIARSVEDLRLLLAVLCGPSPAALDSATRKPPAPGPRRVARLCDQLGATVDPAIERRLDETCAAFEAAGYEVVAAEIPGGARLPELFAELVGTELLSFTLPQLGGEIGDETRRYLETMFGPRRLSRLAELIAAQTELATWASLIGSWMEDRPLVVAPVVGAEPPRIDFDRDLSPAAAGLLFDQMRNAVWVNLLGLPAAALPNGVQIVGRRFAEGEILDAAAAVEGRIPEPPRLVGGERKPIDSWKVEDE